MNTIGAQLSEAFRGLLDSIIAQTPRIAVGFVLVLLAFVVARLVERALRAALKRVRLDAAMGRLGADEAVRRIGISQPLSHVLARITYFLFLLLFLRTAADGLGIAAVSSAIGALFAYLPNVIAAAVILVLGSVAAQAAGKVVGRAAANSGIEFASSLGSLVTGVLMVVLGIMAVGQLRLDTEIVRVLVMGILAAVALAFGLSFGLGSRDVMRNILAGFYARKTFQMGEPLEIGEARGRLTAITPTQTILEDGDQIVAVANSAFLEQVVRQ